jgi:hypothetical protein
VQLRGAYCDIDQATRPIFGDLTPRITIREKYENSAVPQGCRGRILEQVVKTNLNGRLK